MKNSNCIIITQKEWLNWLAFGYLRISPSRISYFDNTESKSSFDKLISYSVDNALDEEDAYLIASLVNDYSREELHVKRTSLSDYILVQAVQGFYTLSAKGADLLEYEAGQSHSILLYDSKIENLWNEWKNTQFKIRSHDKGNKFLEILEYPRFEVEPKLDDTLFSKLLKNYNRRELPQELQKHNKKNAFSWLVSNYKFSKTVDQSIYNQYKEWRSSSKLSVIYNDPMLKYLATHGECLIEQPSLIAEKIFFEGFYEKKDYFLAISFLVHYYNLLDNDYEINLQFLKTDLSFLDEIYSTKDISQLIAYFIGRRLNEVYLNSLYIAKNIDEKRPSMFVANFFSNLKNEKLTLCNVDEVQLQEIVKKVNVIAEEIKLAYNKEVNNVQDSELESDAIKGKDSNLNSSTEPQVPIIDSDNSETNNIPIENLDISSNTTNDDSTQPHSEAQNTVGSEKSEDSTNRINIKNEVINEHNKDINSLLETKFKPSDEKDYIKNLDVTEAIPEPKITNKLENSDQPDQPDQPDLNYHMKLALSIYSKLEDSDNTEKNTFTNFIKNFIEDDGIDESTKNKLKRIKQKDFFNLFSELIEDKASYKDIDYRKFKAMLKNKNDPGLL